jgi:hypothetical protein
MRIALGVTGLAAIGYGAWLWLLGDGAAPVGQTVFLAVVLAGHDFVVLPVAIVAGWLLSRYLPGWARGPARLALFVSAVLTVVALPFVIGAGRIADNPSAFPRHYGLGLLAVICLMWTVAAAAAAVNRRRAGR